MFTNADDLIAYLTGGRATLTVKSLKTGNHYTYKVRAAKDSHSMFFVQLLVGPDNSWDGDWLYLGYISLKHGLHIYAGAKGQRNHTAFEAMEWLLTSIGGGRVPETAEVRHEGTCCRCGRKLTHPESLASGIGPECIKKMAA